MIECVDTRFFKLERNAHTFIDEMNSYGYWCQLTRGYKGYVVNVFMEM